jgi:pyruvate dehydrogenase E1 component alpha subunit
MSVTQGRRSAGDATEKGPGRADLLTMLYTMKLTRALEERIERRLYRQGKIVGGVYVGRGQEAIGAGTGMHVRRAGDPDRDDVVFPSHRDMGLFLMQGIAPRRVLAQYMGRRTGPTRGRDANMHMGDLGRRVVSFISHLGDTLPVAAGCALAFRMRGTDQVAFVLFGDGTTSRADWHTGVNLAAVQRLPVVLICVNNQYAYSTPLSRQMAVARVADRAAGYGIPGETVDGNDVLAVWDAVGRAAARARGGGGPTLIEGVTFRMTGHSAHDDAGYVPDAQREEWRGRDPIARLVAHLEERRWIDRAALAELDRRIDAEIDDAVGAAEIDPWPAPEECLEGVYHGTGGDAWR